MHAHTHAFTHSECWYSTVMSFCNPIQLTILSKCSRTAVHYLLLPAPLVQKEQEATGTGISMLPRNTAHPYGFTGCIVIIRKGGFAAPGATPTKGFLSSISLTSEQDKTKAPLPERDTHLVTQWGIISAVLCYLDSKPQTQGICLSLGGLF